MNNKKVSIEELEKVFGFDFYDDFTEEEKENTIVTLFEDGSVENEQGHQICEPSEYVDFNADEKVDIDEITYEMYEELSLEYSEDYNKFENYDSAYDMIMTEDWTYWMFCWCQENYPDMSNEDKIEITERVTALLKADQ